MVDLITEDGVRGSFDCEQAESLKGQGAGRSEPRGRNLLWTFHCPCSLPIYQPGRSYPPGHGLHTVVYFRAAHTVRYLLLSFLFHSFPFRKTKSHDEDS